MFADPQVEHLKVAQPVRVKKGAKPMTLVGQPFGLSRTPSRLAAPPPAIGAHTDAVLAEFGFTKAQIAALKKAKAV